MKNEKLETLNVRVKHELYTKRKEYQQNITMKDECIERRKEEVFFGE